MRYALGGVAMLVNEYRTDVVPSHERWDLWQDIVARTHLPILLRSGQDADFRAVMRVLSLGDVQVAGRVVPRPWSRRGPAGRSSASTPRCTRSTASSRARAGSPTHGRRSSFGPGDLVIVDSSTPYEARHTPPPGRREGCSGRTGGPDRTGGTGGADGASGADGGGGGGDRHAGSGTGADTDTGAGVNAVSVVVTVPRALLPLPPRTLRRALAVPIPVGRGMGGALHRWLADLTARADEFGPGDAATLGGVTTDLLTSVLGHALDAEDTMSPESRRRALHTRTLDFIDRNLGDPALSPATVAAAHGVSVRHLHQVFAEEGDTPAAWIRHRRLEHCRRDLADPGQRSRPIAALAARWGFQDAAAFSRQFRRAYGMSPRDYRHRP